MLESAPPQLNVTTLATAVFSILGASLVWYRRVGRLTRLRQTVSQIYALSEEILGAANAEEIRQRLDRGLDGTLQLRNVALLTASLSGLDVAAGRPLDGQAARRAQETAEPVLEGLLLSLPMFFEGKLAGVLQCDSTGPVRLQPDELSALRHLANQAAIALELLDRRRLRDQLLRSEKLGAVGQLISSIAAELEPPLLRLQASSGDQPDLAAATQTLHHLISLGHPEQARIQPFDLNEALQSLAAFRQQSWRLGLLDATLDLSSEPLVILGSRGQTEQALLSLLVHAEQSLQHAATRRLDVSSSAEEGQAVLEIAFSAPPAEGSSELAWGLGVARGIIESHGGDLEVSSSAATTRFRLRLPLSLSRVALEQAVPAARPEKMLTLLLVHPDGQALRPLVAALSSLEQRVVPVSSGAEAIDLATRLRFDAIFAPHQLPEGPWMNFAPRARECSAVVGLIATPSDPAQPGIPTLALPPDLEAVARTLRELGSNS